MRAGIDSDMWYSSVGLCSVMGVLAVSEGSVDLGLTAPYRSSLEWQPFSLLESFWERRASSKVSCREKRKSGETSSELGKMRG